MEKDRLGEERGVGVLPPSTGPCSKIIKRQILMHVRVSLDFGLIWCLMSSSVWVFSLNLFMLCLMQFG